MIRGHIQLDDANVAQEIDSLIKNLRQYTRYVDINPSVQSSPSPSEPESTEPVLAYDIVEENNSDPALVANIVVLIVLFVILSIIVVSTRRRLGSRPN
jgi:hypothetical protein